MLRKLVGCNLTVISTIICFILFKLVIHHEYDSSILTAGVFFVIWYSIPFIGIAGILSFVFDKTIFKIKVLRTPGTMEKSFYESSTSRGYIILRIVFHIAVGFITACIVSIVFRFHSLDIVAFICITCIVGSIVFQYSYVIHNRLVMYGMGIVIPIGLLLFSLYIS